MKDFDYKQVEQEKDAKRNGTIFTVLFHALVLLFLIFTMAWTPPDPPIPEYGIEVNFGMIGTEGSKNIQNKTKPNDSDSFEKAKPNPKPTKEPVVDKPDPLPKPTPKEVVKEVVKDPIEELTPVTESADKGVEAVKKEEVKKEEPKPKGSTDNNTGTADKDIANNEGKKEEGVGDRGDEKGSLDADALLGGGSGGGATLNLDGWKWTETPTKKDSSSETGKVVIKFKIDRDGLVISATIASRTVSSTTAEFYRNYVESELMFIPKNEGRVPNFTIGSITFVITNN
jgi:protein TonB